MGGKGTLDLHHVTKLSKEPVIETSKRQQTQRETASQPDAGGQHGRVHRLLRVDIGLLVVTICRS